MVRASVQSLLVREVPHVVLNPHLLRLHPDAVLLQRALAVFGRKLWIAALIGAVAVPLNYGAGAKMGAVDLPLGTGTTATSLIVVWFFLLPSLYRLAKHLGTK